MIVCCACCVYKMAFSLNTASVQMHGEDVNNVIHSCSFYTNRLYTLLNVKRILYLSPFDSCPFCLYFLKVFRQLGYFMLGPYKIL